MNRQPAALAPRATVTNFRAPQRRVHSCLPGLALAALPFTLAAAAPGDTDLVSVSPLTARGSNAAMTGYTGPNDSVSAGGRYVVFSANANAMGHSALHSRAQAIYVRDRSDHATHLASRDESGAAQEAWDASISASGDHVVFTTAAALLGSDTNGTDDVYLYTLATQAIERVSVANAGREGRCDEFYSVGYADVSPDGRYVAFSSCADLTAGPLDDDGEERVFLRDRLRGTTELLFGGARRGDTGYLKWGHRISVSDDGRYVYDQGLLHDRVQRKVTVPQLHSDAAQAAIARKGHPDIRYAALSGNGRYLVFASSGPDVEPGDTNGYSDVYLRDLQQGRTERLSLDHAGKQVGAQALYPQISSDGRHVAFYAHASWQGARGWQGLVPDSWSGIYVRDRQAGTLEYVSVDAWGGPVETFWYPSLSADGRFVTFGTAMAVAGDPADAGDGDDVYVHECGAARKPSHQFAVNPHAIDFGTQPLGIHTGERFWIRNDGRSALPLRYARIVGEDRVWFTRSRVAPQLVAPGAQVPVRITLRAHESGVQNAALRLVLGDDSVHHLPLEATVR